ncbi:MULTISPECIES: efflux RND transporter permease subunit [unclassified Ketobacter]|uniref:efflux RND transporter permease subunit n=1 Tax=unclassified Ketobacter TaxID=2639109 RepID=UPI000F2C277C|nr:MULTISPECIES: MMPL family transporter [unclassified Ketobacter]MCK5792374.1 RND family transporter [Ketobacter sp.]RLT88753.1 MAG: RND family transporter [Ketobacter sp. GenoA1]RLT97646.1 MAG: RND family transporter [Ketobacter sp.]
MSTKNSTILEESIFKLRPILLLAFAVLTAFFAFEASKVKLSTEFEKMVPLKHEFIQNLLKHKDELSLGNDIRIVVEAKNGDIFTDEFMQVLRQVTDEIFYFEGVDKAKIQSLWTPNVRWMEVTEDGFRGGEIIPPTYDGSAESLEQVQANVLRSGQVGRLVADDFESSIVYVPLLDQSGANKKLDYKKFSAALEQDIRQKFQSDNINIRIVGFAKKIGDLIEGATGVALFFIIAIGITFVLLLIDSKCIRSTFTVIICSVIAVIWQVGILTLLGKGIDPYSMLVPFLIFAIGVSHGVQLINEFAVESHRINFKLEAARLTFRALYVPALLALISDAIGFMTLWTIEIHVIQDLAISAALGVFALIFTNLLMIPVLLSYVGASPMAVNAMNKKLHAKHVIWSKISRFATPKAATVSVIIAAIGAGAGLYISKDLKIGDLDAGAPELWPDSRYNLDDKYVNEHYSVSADVLVVMVETPEYACTESAAMQKMDRFMWHMENVPGVQSALSVVTVSKRVITGFNEGNWKWAALTRVQDIINNSVQTVPGGLVNTDCSLAPVIVFLDDHKAETLDRAVAAVQEFAAAENDPDVAEFVLASGNAGVEAATNETIEHAQNMMKVLVYGVVSILCLITFRSIRAVICIIVPLALTSILCQALMTILGIGVKVATLPVIALGVGIGVDYGIYIYSRLKGFMEDGMELEDAYFETLKVTGKAVCFTGLTLAIGVGTWIFSDIKFQANMGVLLTFMFLWNMVGAIWLLPALANFLIRGKIKKKA